MLKVTYSIIKNSILIILFFSILMGFKTFQDDWIVPGLYKNMKNPYAGVEDEDDIGKDLYSVHCRSCHGKSGLGDGSKAFELDSDVKDFTANSFKSQSDGSVYFKIIMGRNEMPSFDKKINSEEDRWLLVNYIKSL